MQLANAFLGTRMRMSVQQAPQALAPTPRQVTCMARKKGIRCIVTLECTEAKAEGATASRYVTQKNRKNTPERLEVRKYNKYLKRYTLHKEIK